MPGTKKIMILALVGVILLFGIYNWRSYLKTEGISRPVAKSSNRGDAGSSSNANATITTPQAALRPAVQEKRENTGVGGMEPEPPKRPPLEGNLLHNPFYNEAAVRHESAGRVEMPPVNRGSESVRGEGPGYMLELVLVDEGRRWAIVNGRLYTTGDRLGNMMITGIEPGKIMLEDELRKVRILSLSSDKDS